MLFDTKKSTLLLTFLVIIAVFVFYFKAYAAIAKVSSIEGMAIYKEGDEGWKPLKPGMEISGGISIRVQEKSRIEAAFDGRGSWAAMGPAQIETGKGEKHKQGFDFKLERGHIAVLYQPEDPEEKLVIETIHGKMTAGAGVFSVISDGEGKTEVASGKGTICFHHGKTLCADEGQMLILKKTPDGPESDLRKVPPDINRLWVKLKWPIAPKKPALTILRPQDGMFFSEPNIYVTGTTTPGATVMVNKTEVPVNRNGSFSGTVSLYEGENTLDIQAISPSGGTENITVTVHLDNTPPMLTISQPIDGFDPTTIGTCDQRICYIQVFGLTEPGVSLLINGVNASRYIEDDGSFLIQDYPISLDERTLTIEVEDMLRQRTIEILHMVQPMDTDGDGQPDVSDACPTDPTCQ